MKAISCTIREGETDGWDISFPGMPVAHIGTAVDALASVTAHTRALPYSSILTIKWQPRTPIGLMVVKVVTA